MEKWKKLDYLRQREEVMRRNSNWLVIDEIPQI